MKWWELRARVQRLRSPLASLWLAVATACTSSPPPTDPGSEQREAALPAAISAVSPISEPPLVASARLEDLAAPEPPPPLEPPPFKSDETFQLAIRGGEVIDGSGKPRRRADVLIRGTEIAFVGRVDPAVKAERTLDATGAVVTPGFIDAHAHGDPRGGVEQVLAMGVTTVVVGQDGMSPGKRIGAYLAAVEAARPRVNVATLVGHASARAEAGIGSPKQGPRRYERLAAWIARGLDEGAFGLSTGLEYDGGRSATPEELAAAAAPVGARGGVVMSHLRSEDDDRIEGSLDELFEQCRKSGARAHVAHLKVVYGKGATRAEAILAKLAAARASGLSVTADLYPYTASYTSLEILFPDFARPPQSYSSAKQRRRKDLAEFLRAKVMKRNGPEATLFGTGAHAGKTLAAVATARGVPFEEVLMDLGPHGAEAAYFVMDEPLMERLFVDPFVMISTDGGAGSGHPRAYGAFARALGELTHRRGLVTLEEGVRKMASLPAETLGLHGVRGCLQPGCAADVLVFDPAEVRDRADFRSPRRLAEGMRAVFVNGALAREGSRATSTRSGQVLRSRPAP
ncbi:N-acyl-D-amino-acid deacylase family protein [Chondromyces crocatus]|uniref:Amidohydrolase 3 domain-containing protein n=1 Tax=Chondromyces crocatus TaxID=52 RepID=A0A0K1EGY4_CHOCO|nr:amidohydrolase family protein [Chondromyces crocatus]AKT40104.1 uncharacterized protein CMC5_042570 [Chondromyces crocatus]